MNIHVGPGKIMVPKYSDDEMRAWDSAFAAYLPIIAARQPNLGIDQISQRARDKADEYLIDRTTRKNELKEQ